MYRFIPQFFPLVHHSPWMELINQLHPYELTFWILGLELMDYAAQVSEPRWMGLWLFIGIG